MDEPLSPTKIGSESVAKAVSIWRLPLALVVRGIGCGVFLFVSVSHLLDLIPFQLTTLLIGVGAAWLGIGLATALRPTLPGTEPGVRSGETVPNGATRFRWRRFYRTILVSFVMLTGVWCLVEVAAAREWLTADWIENWRWIPLWGSTGQGLAAVTLPPVLLVQERGHALWRNPLWPVHCVMQALFGGSAFFIVLNSLLNIWGTEGFELANGLDEVTESTFWLLLFANLLVTVAQGVPSLRETEAARQCVRQMGQGSFGDLFWWGALGLGHAVPMGLMMLDHSLVVAQAPFYIWAGLFCFAYAYLLVPYSVQR